MNDDLLFVFQDRGGYGSLLLEVGLSFYFLLELFLVAGL